MCSLRLRLYALIGLATLHIGIIASSNYLIQLPVSILSFNTTWGAFSFPLSFLATDLTVRIFGASWARKIILTVMLPALLISYCGSALVYQGEWQGFSTLGTFNRFLARIAGASFIAYGLGQILDVYIFNRLRRRTRWWIAPTVSMLFGNAADSAVFFFLAFYKSSAPLMAAHWIEIATVDYSVKLIISMMLFLPIYAFLLNLLLKRFAHAKDMPDYCG